MLPRRSKIIYFSAYIFLLRGIKNKYYQLDHIHLNDIGGTYIGNFIWSKFKNIPRWITK